MTDGAVAHVQSPFDGPDTILRGAAATLDLDERCAVVLPGTLDMVADDAVAQHVVDALGDGIASGRYLVLAHTSLDIAPPSTARIIEMLCSALDEPCVTRSRAQVGRLLAGVELVPPGLVPIERWRSRGGRPALASGHTIPILGAVGREPQLTGRWRRS